MYPPYHSAECDIPDPPDLGHCWYEANSGPIICRRCSVCRFSIYYNFLDHEWKVNFASIAKFKVHEIIPCSAAKMIMALS